jgi:hypothetical protein
MRSQWRRGPRSAANRRQPFYIHAPVFVLYGYSLVEYTGGCRWRRKPSLRRPPSRAAPAARPAQPPAPRRAPRVISDCHFRKTGTEYDRKPGIKWLSCTEK